MREEISFGTWLRKQRRALDLTRRAFAAQIGCAEVTLRRIEAGTLKPSKELASILLEKLGMPEIERSQWISFARGLSGFPFPSTRLSNRPITNLPAPLTTFIGREKEQSDVIKLLAKHRLVTLTGSGGVGKTRLAIKVGEQVLGRYADGEWLVDLGPILDFPLIPRTIAVAIGLRDEPQRPVIDMLSDYLREKQMLIILDNCEHLLDACAQLVHTLLERCPDLKILATSREALGILGEAGYPVPSLELPDIQQLFENIRGYESVRLFEERAQLARMNFSLSLEDAPSVAQICSRLDGIPLAIELAAAKIRMLSIEQIAKQLDESFNILTGGNRTALPRHQTLRASMNWSWDLLTAEEQILVRQLSVFAGGWTLEASQAVCQGDVMELTNSLVKKSLIVAKQEAGGEIRYRFHETIRQYAYEKMVEAGEEENIRTQHLNYFVYLAEQAEPVLRGSTQMQWYARLNSESDNIRAALGWAEKTDTESGLFLSSRLCRFWESLDLREGSNWLSRFLERPESHIYPEARAKALYVHGLVLESLQSLEAARFAAEECLKLYRALGNEEGEIDALLLLAIDAWSNGAERMELSKRALELAQLLGDVPRQVEALWYLGYADPTKNRFDYWEKAIGLARSSGDVRAMADILSTMGFHCVLDGDNDSAQKHLDEADILYHQFNMNPPPEHLLAAQGQLALMRGDYENARAYFQESDRIHVEFGNRHEYLFSRVRLGYLALHERNLAEARRVFAETVQDFQKDKYMTGVVLALDGIASISVIVNKPDYATRLVGWTDGTLKKFGEMRSLIEQADVNQIIIACIAKMGEANFSVAYNEGKKMSLAEAVDLALKTVEER